MYFLSRSYPTNPQDHRGFTLTEIVLTVLLVGIFAAIATPSFLSWLDRKRLDDVVAQVEGALKEAQSEAVKKGKVCEVDMGVAVPNVVTATVQGTTDNCLPTGPRDLGKLGVRILSSNNTGIAIASNNTDDILFSPKGTTTTNKLLVFYQPGKTGRCIAISSGLGIIRTGNYTGILNAGDTPQTNDCVPQN